MGNKKIITAVSLIVLAAVIAVTAFLLLRSRETPESSPVFSEPVPTRPTPPPAASAPVQPPAILNPVVVESGPAPLPSLDESDKAFREAIIETFGKRVLTLFLPEHLIRKIVATVDNLPRDRLPPAIVPLRRAPGALRVDNDGDTRVIAADNAERYAYLIKPAATIDVAKVAALYRRFYPLFQKAYEELGYPNAYFNDRLIITIDNLLAAPEPEVPIELVQPKVLYQYADAELEARSAGQKIMIRIGRDNERLLKGKLRELRRALAVAP